MQFFQLNSNIPGVDTIVTALVLSAGTEGTNSIVKFLKYLKEDKKTSAAETLELVRKPASETTASADLPAAKRTLQKLRESAGMTAPRALELATGKRDAIAESPALTFISSK
jgi:hypothetical protein